MSNQSNGQKQPGDSSVSEADAEEIAKKAADQALSSFLSMANPHSELGEERVQLEGNV